MTGSTTIPLSDAKAHLSHIVHSVRDAGEHYTITLRNQPIAMVVPIPTPSPETSSTRGLLSEYASATARAREATAFTEAMEAKHASAS